MTVLRLLTLTVITLSLNCGFVKNLVKAPAKAVRNRQVQKWGSTVCLLTYVCLDAARDAVDHNGGNVNPKYWHAYKNGSIIAGWGCIGLKAIGYGQGHSSLRRLLKRFLFGELPIAWVVWQDIAYDYTKYKRVFDYRPEYNRHRFMLPFFGKDRYMPPPSPWLMGVVDVALVVGGTYGIVKF